MLNLLVISSPHAHMNNTKSEKKDFIPFVTELEEGVPFYNPSTSKRGASLVNCVVETYKDLNDVVKRKVKQRPRINGRENLESAAFRGVFYDVNTGSTWWVVGDKLYVNGAEEATLASSSGQVYFDHYRYGATNGIIAFEAGGNAKVNLFDASTYSLTDSTSTGKTSYAPPVILDGYLFFMEEQTQRIYNSAVGDPTDFTVANDFIDAEMKGDILLAIGKYKNYLVAYGARSIEFFYDAAVEIGSPLRRQTQYARDVGLSPYTTGNLPPLLHTANGPVWLGTTDGYSYGVFMLNNFTPVQVSNPWVHRRIHEHVALNATSKIELHLFGYQGRDLIILTAYGSSDKTTLVYDIKEDFWYEWYFTDNVPNTLEIEYTTPKPTGTTLFCKSGSTYDVFYCRSYTEPGITIYDNTPATITTQLWDFGTQHYKHIRYVDLAGRLLDDVLSPNYIHTVTVRYTSDFTMANWTNHDSKDITDAGIAQSLRWLNFGRHPRIAFQVEITGDCDFALDGLHVTYTEGNR